MNKEMIQLPLSAPKNGKIVLIGIYFKTHKEAAIYAKKKGGREIYQTYEGFVVVCKTFSR